MEGPDQSTWVQGWFWPSLHTYGIRSLLVLCDKGSFGANWVDRYWPRISNILLTLVWALLTLSTLGKIFNRRHFEIFSYFSKKTGFDISCKLSPGPVETICMKCQILFSGKSKVNITNLLSAELAKRVVKVNSFAATGDNNRLLQTAWIQMRRLIMSRLIWIYAVWHSVFQLYI